MLDQLFQYARNVDWGKWAGRAMRVVTEVVKTKRQHDTNKARIQAQTQAKAQAKAQTQAIIQAQAQAKAQTQAIIQSQTQAKAQTQAIIQSQTQASRTLQRGFGTMIASSQQMNSIMFQGFEFAASQLAQVENNMHSLRTDVNQGMQQISGDIHSLQTNVNQGMRQISGDIHSLQTNVNQGMQQLSSDIQSMQTDVNQGMQQLSSDIQSMQTDVNQGMQQVSSNIESLQANFNWGMGAMLWQLEMQQETLQAILQTLQAPLDIQAKELRKRAEFAYRQGWYNEALRDLLESEEKNYQDFAVHQAIGNIYLYHQQPEKDLARARAYYLKAAKYATPHSAYHAALAYMHAGFVCYLQRDDAAAIENARWAIALYPSLTEAAYNHAKFAAAAGEPKIAIPSLQYAIRADRNYAIKARADADFETIEAAVTELMQRLRAEARQKAEAIWLPLRAHLDHYTIFPSPERDKIQQLQSEIEALMAQDTYFAYLDAPAKINDCQALFDSLRLPERNQLWHEAYQLIKDLRAEMAEYVMSATLQKQWGSELAEAEQLLASIATYDNAKQARDKSGACEQQWKEIVTQGRERTVLKGHAGSVCAIAFSPDGTQLASASKDNTVRLWNVVSGKQQATLTVNGVRAIAFSPDGTQLACASSNRYYEVQLWDVDQSKKTVSGHKQATLQHDNQVNTIAFSPNGKTLASGSANGTVQLWDVTSKRVRTILQGHTAKVLTLAFSTQGTMLASGSADNTVRLWELMNEYELKVHTRQVNAIAFSPDSTLLVSCSGDNSVRLWDVATKNEQAKLTEHTGEVLAISFSPDGMTVASASNDKTVRLWDVTKQSEQAVLAGHSDSVKAIAFSPYGTMLAFGSANGTVSLRDWIIRRTDLERQKARAKHGNELTNLQQAIEIDPDNPSGYASRGRFYLKQNQHEQAIADFSKAIELAPDHDITYYSRGFAYQKLGEDEKAIVDFKRYIDLSTNLNGCQQAEDRIKQLEATA